MKSDVTVVQFVNSNTQGSDDDFQNYLNGDNKWDLPILERDIVDVKYTYDESKEGGVTSIFLMHRVPSPQITR